MNWKNMNKSSWFCTFEALSNSQGHALLELAIVLPLLWTLMVAGVEFGRALNRYQVALSLSQQITRSAYRECIVDAGDFASSQLKDAGKHNPLFEPNTCLARIRDSFSASVTNIAPDAEFFISMYRNQSDTVTRDGFVFFQGAAPRYNTKLNEDQFRTIGAQGSGDLGRALKDYEILIIAEIYVPHNAIIGNFLDYFFTDSGALYAATIL